MGKVLGLIFQTFGPAKKLKLPGPLGPRINCFWSVETGLSVASLIFLSTDFLGEFSDTMKKSLKRNVEDVDSKKATEVSSKPEEGVDEDVGPMLPPGFVPSVAAPSASSSSKTKNSDTKKDGESSDSDSSDSDSSDSEDEDDSRMTLPISSEIILNHGTKPIPAMALDPSGARLLTGPGIYRPLGPLGPNRSEDFWTSSVRVRSNGPLIFDP